MLMAFVRGANPIWYNVDLTGLPFNDGFYLFTLQNTLPYLPAPVYQDPDGNVVWDNPIQYFANGTLPNNIYFDDTIVYRLEFRQGPTQYDPLIYLVENYEPDNEQSITPITSNSNSTDNVITNPQFSVVNFSNPLTTSSNLFEIAPGWFIAAVGASGSITVNQIQLIGTDDIATNASYGLQIISSGWTQIILRQRFNMNGALWAGESVATSVSALSPNGSAVSLFSRLVYSDGEQDVVINGVPLSQGWQQIEATATIPLSTNPNPPASAWTDYEIYWTAGNTINITSIQLVGQELPENVSYIQLPIERQIDQTFHVYANSLIMQPKGGLLTGWNFPLNPYQFYAYGATTAASAAQYIADQTILVSNASTLSTSWTNDGINIAAISSTTQAQFAVVQYIDTTLCAPYWQYNLSVLARLKLVSTNSTSLGVKFMIAYRSNTPPNVNPVASFGTNTINLSTGWTGITCNNDVTGTFTNINSPLNYAYNQFTLPADPGAGSNFCIIMYTTNAMSAAGTPDVLQLQKISLVPNDFAIEEIPKTFNQVLSDCQFYYEGSYGSYPIASGTAFPATYTNALRSTMFATYTAGSPSIYSSYVTEFGFTYKVPKRSLTPTLTLISPNSGTINTVTGGVIFYTGTTVAQTLTDALTSLWNHTNIADYAAFYSNFSAGAAVSNPISSPIATGTGGTNIGAWVNGFIIYQYTIDARLGLVA